MIKAVLFDIGNVLVRFDFSLAISRLAQQSMLSQEEIGRILHTHLIPLELGTTTAEEFVSLVTSAIHFAGSTEEFRSAFCEIFSPNQPMWGLAEKLCQQLPCFHLSNTSSLHEEYLFTEFPIFSQFHGGAYSWRSESMKPARKIYEDAIALAACRPDEILYLDDLEANILTGKEIGMQTLHYHPDDHARCTLELARHFS